MNATPQDMKQDPLRSPAKPDATGRELPSKPLSHPEYEAADHHGCDL